MKDERTIKELIVSNGDATHLEVKLSYKLGGMNYFQGAVMERGIYLSVTPVSKSENTRSYKAFSGVTSLIKEMKRFSQKTFDNFEVDEDGIQGMIDHVVAKNGLTLKK